jgi:uncharacterized iron-regulated protein
MSRLSYPLHLAAVLCLCALTACCPAGKHLMGDPQDPYPRTTPPRVGDIVHLPTGTIVSTAQMLAVAGDMRIVYIGEVHDNPAAHRLELQVLQELAELHPDRQALGMEIFARSQQPVLDLWVAGELDEKAFLRETRWYDSVKMDFDYYRDLLIFARDRRIPVIALNAEKGLVEAVRGTAPEQLSAGERARLPDLDLTDPYQRGMATAIFGDHSHGAMQLDGFLRAQTVWDESMAESVSRYLVSPAGRDRHLLVIAGGNHVNYGFGIPRRAFRRLPVSYVIIGGEELDIPADKQDRLMNVKFPLFPMVPYDFVAYLAYEDLPERGVRLGVMMEPAAAGRGLKVRKVLPGSNAERAGLRQGDLLLALDGENLASNLDLIYALKQKHPGDHGVLQVVREGGQPKSLEVIFQTSAGN